LQETVVAEKESGPQLNQLGVHEKRTLFHVLTTLRGRVKACMLQCQRARNCNYTSHKGGGSTSPQSVQGLPRCILQTKGKDAEMGLLLADSEVQLQEVKSLYKVKEASILQQLHQLARQIENTVVLFPRSLKRSGMSYID